MTDVRIRNVGTLIDEFLPVRARSKGNCLESELLREEAMQGETGNLLASFAG